ncbi:MAG: acyl-CoA dehydrogenase family protein [Pseudomonadota bacterium]
MNEETAMIAEATARIFADLADPQTVNAASCDAWKAPLWRALDEAGLTRAWMSEDNDGAGLDLATGFEILRVSGHYACPVALGETLLAGWTLEQAGLAVPDGVLTLAPMRRGGGVTIADGKASGTARSVAHGGDAGHLVAVMDNAIALVPLAEATVTPRQTDMGGDRTDLAFDGVAATTADVPGAAGMVQMMGATARACQITGALETALSVTTDYTGEREAFGRKIGKFQAVQQNLAQLAGEVAAAITASGSAAETLSKEGLNSEAALLEVASAKIRVGEAAETGGAIAHQAHGAIGWTSDYVLQRFTRRMWGWRDDFGTEAEWAVRLGNHVAALGSDGLWPMLTAR